ncbi:MAG: hypothetical protein QOF51_262 [Chloroflexota bacterium]|jgi:hypothetical protein|nr:hypothetical protein [Chloroflexota bacterium]
MEITKEPAYKDLVGRAIESGKFELLQIWFESNVLDRYREDPDSRIMRTDSAGRLRGPGNWMVNFGISSDDAFIHMSAVSTQAIPEGHRQHWLDHLVAPQMGATFVRIVLNPNACIGDGPTRDW